ncbi:pyruvate,water dikinase [Clostridium acetobutylicum]|uniref:Phosphoenolpyruvate synthase n=1 Tax=Clostridium acetobutylicum (strain ATCC 824 / DSM 792 / JCM 1419 / IAM 19013 / LMG 5710 / NBRC 13948 / NRRL B-527 / VKM B-1787 / 2291 / W) TaxID=272562 RepID=Q97KW9_CLOAB|nr:MULTISPECIES: PEP/pyruvate-binding domain-containing protein [Clostridium]AAK78773.1 Phosphoenolpyruvate synthase [Clostridium acetobutylicum ATCC 824]ADZ19847.1 Phosphoenolpyruvate synthase [Clostridium acetobutylicum EA 2018]AEI34055.1 phosphoenolpyruvate synthase [Clostridium acetobutylicum DSM 1731]AWV80491.1 phosphoenolpyruvate synthase [Clostridium acetobutylicum]MBC2392681.1 phosphoenolpyruvate synthase [Clostridium acetobutylicum]
MIFDIAKGEVSQELGNKAKSLIEMRKEGFRVPDGFVIDSNTYKEIISYNEKEEDIKNILSTINKSNIDVLSIKLASIFDDFVIMDSLVNEIDKRLKKGVKYAVRSSGLKEDLDNLSFAGQYSTFLNIGGIEEIKKAIIDCYKSMYTKGVLSYFIDNNLEVRELEMAVIVQEMVQSEKSGVAFTVNPITGIDKEMVVEVTEGLGEAIVSGQVVPERYIYNWFEDKYEYSETNSLLSKEELEKIMNTALNIQMHFGYPSDIEFAIEKDKLYILQVRAITKIKYSKIKDEWTTANFKDSGVSASVCTPAMWSLYEYIWETVLKKFILQSNILKEKELNKLGDMFYGRPYWNMSVVKKAMGKIPGYKEIDFDNEFGVKITYKGEGNTTKLTPASIIKVIRIAFAQRKIVKNHNKNLEAYKNEILGKYSKYIEDYETEYSLKEFETIWYDLIKDDYLTSQGTYFWQIFINTIHQTIFKNKILKYLDKSQYLDLIGGLNEVSHLRPFYDMWDITRNIIKDENSFSFWNSSTVEEIKDEYYKNTEKYFMIDFKKYVNNYGHHSKKELDVTYPCYFEDVDTLIKMFKDTILLDDSYSPRNDKKRQIERYTRQIENIKEKVSDKKYRIIIKEVEKMREMLWWREEFRDMTTKFYYIIRIYTLKLAKLYKAYDIIEDEDDIWYLKIFDIWDFIDGRKTKQEIKAIVLRNRKYYQSFRNFENENEIGTKFEGINESKKVASNKVIGVGCNNGIVTGTARVIEDLEEIETLKVGDILITKFTDTGWTSKFAMLKGIVTEYGGLLCHAAIVSREYGMPCIVCAHNATKLIKDGSRISINGTTGEITLLEGGI